MGIYISLLSILSHLKPYTEGATTMVVDVKTRTKDGCNLIPSSRLNRMCKDLTRRKHNLAEERPQRKLEFTSVRFTVVFVNLRVVKNARCLLACRTNGFIWTQFIIKRNFCNACEDDRVLDCKIH